MFSKTGAALLLSSCVGAISADLYDFMNEGGNVSVIPLNEQEFLQPESDGLGFDG
jgi:hypothetical protein